MLSTYTVAMKIFAIRGIEKRSIEEFKEIYELPWINIYKKLGVDIEMDEEYALWRKLSPKYEKLVVPIAGAKETLKKLKDLGNSVIVVEHDHETMLFADHIVDVGPGAGVHGG